MLSWFWQRLAVKHPDHLNICLGSAYRGQEPLRQIASDSANVFRWLVNAAMRSALEDSGSKALVLLINSPGGSPSSRNSQLSWRRLS